MMETKESVCAVVVTFNRKNLLIECLEALRKQTRPIQAMYIIDNFSSDGTPQLLLDNGYIKELPPENLKEPWEKEFNINNLVDGQLIKVHYVRMHENTGGAGGFYEGVKRGYERGYDWLWLMDDDVEPLGDALEKMLQYKHISLCIHPSKQYSNGEIFGWEGWIDYRTGFGYQFVKDEFRENKEWTCVNFGCFEGMLIHKYVVSKIGYPDKKLFFIGDDTLYGYKASKVTNNIYIKDIVFYKKIDKRNERLSRLAFYLIYRNTYCFVFRKIAKNKFLWFISLLYILTSNIGGRILKFELIKIFDILSGTIDGIFGIWGKEKRYIK